MYSLWLLTGDEILHRIWSHKDPFQYVRILHDCVHVHAKSALRGVRVDGVLLSKMRGWNALICLNMHAVELRCGDTGQNNNNKKHRLIYCSEAIWGFTEQEKQNSMSPFENICTSRSTRDVSPRSCYPQAFALVIFSVLQIIHGLRFISDLDHLLVVWLGGKITGWIGGDGTARLGRWRSDLSLSVLSPPLPTLSCSTFPNELYSGCPERCAWFVW